MESILGGEANNGEWVTLLCCSSNTTRQ